jgi:hypothetical protein
MIKIPPGWIKLCYNWNKYILKAGWCKWKEENICPLKGDTFISSNGQIMSEKAVISHQNSPGSGRIAEND